MTWGIPSQPLVTQTRRMGLGTWEVTQALAPCLPAQVIAAQVSWLAQSVSSWASLSLECWTGVAGLLGGGEGGQPVM